LICRELQQTSSANGGDYCAAFVINVHRLLYVAYARMNPEQYPSKEEPAISGDLVKAMEEVLNDPAAPDWIPFYSVHDDPPEHDEEREGKRRLRIDVKVVSSERRPRQRFAFEAKRLGQPSHPVRKYLGEGGLGCFLLGHYARFDDDVGMLGYVQSGDPASWANEIAGKFAEAPLDYGICAGAGSWERFSRVEELPTCYRSTHRRISSGPVNVYHTLLIMH
jgi:hypothetical protein